MKDVTLLVEGDVNFSPARMDWYAQLDSLTQAGLEEDSEVFLHQARCHRSGHPAYGAVACGSDPCAFLRPEERALSAWLLSWPGW